MVETTGESNSPNEEKLFDLPSDGIVDTQYSTTEWACEELGLINADNVISNFVIDDSQDTYQLRYNANYYYRAPTAQARISFSTPIPLFDLVWQYQDEEEQDILIIDDDPSEVPPLEIRVENILEGKEIVIHPLTGVTEASSKNYHFKLVFPPGFLVQPENIQAQGDWSILYSKGRYDDFYLLWKGSEPITIVSEQFIPDDKAIILKGVAVTLAEDSSEFDELLGTTIRITTSWQFKQGHLDVISVSLPDFIRHNKYTTSLTQTLTMVTLNTSNASLLPLFVGFVGSNKVLNTNGETSNLTLRITNTNLPGGNSIQFRHSNDSDYTTASYLQIMLEAGEDDWALGTADEVNNITISPNGAWRLKAGPTQVIVEGALKGYTWDLAPTSDVILVPQGTIQISITGITTSKPTGETNLYLSYNYARTYKDGKAGTKDKSGQFICQIEKSPLVYPAKIGSQSNTNVGIGTTSPSKTLDIDGNLHVAKELDVDGSLKVNNINSISTINFVNQVDAKEDQIQLCSPELYHAIGVQPSVTFFRTSDTFAWYGHGSYSQEPLNPGPDGYVVMVINGDQVGIGTTSPSEKLEVNGTTKTTDLNVTGTSNFANLNATGNVGIGTTYPSAKLEVDGKIKTTDKVGINIHKEYGSDPTIDLAIGDNDTGIKWISDGNIAIYNNGSEKVRFTNNGNVGIGTTSPSAKLDVNGTLKVNTIKICNESDDSKFVTLSVNNNGQLEINGQTIFTENIYLNSASVFGQNFYYRNECIKYQWK